MTENLKKLTGKNKNDYETVAKHLVDDCDVELFKELVDNDDFLFDFVKNNVAQRIEAVVNENNYQNLLEFLKYYSQSYEDVIINSLVKYADEDLTDTMLDKFENGTDSEKTYASKYFAKIQDPLAHDFLIKNSYSNNEYLAQNCAHTLGQWHDEESYNFALEKLKSDDDFEKLSGVKFLTSYGDQKAIPLIFEAMKTSTMAENIAGEIPYLENLFDEDKNTKNEVFDIKKLLNNIHKKDLEKYINDELKEDSPFVYTALDFATDTIAIRELLKSNNQTLILKTAEILKSLGNFDETARTVALLKVTDINIKAIIRAL